jgi:hypothetical protein
MAAVEPPIKHARHQTSKKPTVVTQLFVLAEKSATCIDCQVVQPEGRGRLSPVQRLTDRQPRGKGKFIMKDQYRVLTMQSSRAIACNRSSA